jgi:hypothetical protein
MRERRAGFEQDRFPDRFFPDRLDDFEARPERFEFLPPAGIAGRRLGSMCDLRHGAAPKAENSTVILSQARRCSDGG